MVGKIGASPSGLTTDSTAPTINKIATASWEKSDRCVISNPQVAPYFTLRLQPVVQIVTRLPSAFFKKPISLFTDKDL